MVSYVLEKLPFLLNKKGRKLLLTRMGQAGFVQSMARTFLDNNETSVMSMVVSENSVDELNLRVLVKSMIFSNKLLRKINP